MDGYPYAVVRALHCFKSGDLTRATRELDAAAQLRSESEPFWPTVERCVHGAVGYWSGDIAGARTDFAAAATLTSLSLREIASELSVSYNTATTRPDAVEAARAAGLLTTAQERPPSRPPAARNGRRVPGGEAP